MTDKVSDTQLIMVERIESLILSMRGQKVILDKDLATLYGVATKRLNEQVRRNRQRFPPDFMFQLTKEEFEDWRSQTATSNPSVKMGLRRRPFTEHGAIMAASILNTPRAVEVSVFVVRAFVKLRQLALTHKELASKLDQLEKKVADHDDAIRQLVQAIRRLVAPPEPKGKRVIGFAAGRRNESMDQESGDARYRRCGRPCTASVMSTKSRWRENGLWWASVKRVNAFKAFGQNCVPK